MSDFHTDSAPYSPTHNPIERSLNAASGIGGNNEYLRLTKTLTYSYIFVLPLIIFYEFGIWLINAGELSQIRIGADILIKRMLQFIGINGTFWFSLVLLAVGGVIFWYERKEKIPIRPRYLLFMLIESAIFGILIGMVVASFVASVFSLTWPPTLQTAAGLSVTQGLVLSLGAGFYEELVFRLILVTVLVWLISLLKTGKRLRYIVAAVIGALIFSAVHYIGDLGDVFTFSSFTFRFLMGLALNGLFLWRGFGIAAMTHALYDIFVTIMQA